MSILSFGILIIIQVVNEKHPSKGKAPLIMSTFRIRMVPDDLYPMNQQAVKKVIEILKSQFQDENPHKIDSLPELLKNPLKYKFRTLLFVAEDLKGKLKACAVLSHAPDLQFAFLDYLATSKDFASSGMGGALYERAREIAEKLKVVGLFMECLPDELQLCNDNSLIKDNRARLKFYERYGARPIINSLYESPVKDNDTCPPYLLCDLLDKNQLPPPVVMQKIVDAILRRKYANYCPEDYIQKVVGSFASDAIALREPRYAKPKTEIEPTFKRGSREMIYLAINDKHSIHHIKDKAYVEAPVRIEKILKELDKTGLMRTINVVKFPEHHIREVHSDELVDYLKLASDSLKPEEHLYPYVFPVRNPDRKPRDLNVASGYYCIDTFTPITSNVYLAARGAVDCALSCASKILEGHLISYALVRPPGHHAERKVFGGFCYLNSSAIAANYLSKFGKVAMLDIDFHHGNGQQDIFYKRSDVLTISIHGHPSYAYPYFCGFKDEMGEGPGYGFNYNFPLPENTDGKGFRLALGSCISIIRKFKPDYLVVPLGLDIAKGDPTGTWNVSSKDFELNGKMIGSLRLPTLVVQEGGYLNRVMGSNAVNFFKGLYEACYNQTSSMKV